MNRVITSHYSPLTMFRWRLYFVLTVLLLSFVALPQSMQAVSPAPDGGYPGFNTAEGQNALLGLTTGQGNTAVGWFSLKSVTGGSFNTATGAGTLLVNTADNNTAFGAAALLNNTSGGGNTAVGTSALASNTSGFYNIAIGDDTLSHNVSGSHNIIVGGFAAGFNIVAGSNNIYIGPGVSANGPFDESDTIRINDSAPAASGASSQVFFAGISGSTVGAVSAPVLINPNGQLGTGVSSARFKKDIDPMGTSSETIFSLEPVTFHYKGDTTNTPQFGLIAEEVAKVNRALILVDKEGKPYSVRYEQVNAMLLNEFLKEHRTVQELEAKITRQQKDSEMLDAKQLEQIEALTARLDEQAAQLQKVSEQLQTNNPAGGLPSIVSNPRRYRGTQQPSSVCRCVGSNRSLGQADFGLDKPSRLQEHFTLMKTANR
jgi:Chaperone of endosialidase